MSSRIDRMAKLIELAEIELDKAGKTLAAVQEQYVHEKMQLDSLMAYEKEYAAEPVKKDVTMTLAQLQTRHSFGEKLRQAVVTQSFQVDELENSIERVKDHWLEKRAEVKSLQLLLEKLQRDQQVKLNRQEQRLLDELAAQKMIADKKNNRV